MLGGLALSLLLPGAAVGADGLAIEQTMEISGMPGQPPMSSTQKLWLAPGKMRMEMQGGGMPGMANMTTIIRTDLKKVFILDDQAQTYMEMPADFAGGMSGDMQIKCDLQATGRQKKIKDWNCTEYIITTTGGPAATKMTLWATEDIKYDAKLRESMLEATAKNPMLKPLADKLRDLKGFPVEQNIEIDMGGMKMTTATRLNSAVQQSIPDDKFEVPKSYTPRATPR